MSPQLVQRRSGGTGGAAHEGAGVLSEAGVGGGDHRDLDHPREKQEPLLHLGGADVLAAADDDVLLAVGEGQVLAVEHADVAGGEPAVAVDAGVGQRGIEISREQVWSARHDLPRLAGRQVHAVIVDDADLDAGERSAVAVEAPVGRVAGGASGDRRMLGAAVEADQRDPHRGGPIGDRRGDRSAAQAQLTHQRQVSRTQLGMIEQAGQEIGGAAARGEAVLQHRVEDDVRLPEIDQVDRLAAVHRHQQSTEQPDGVADRRAHQRRWSGGCRGGQLAYLRSDAAMGVHRAPRLGGGAGGVGDQRRTIGVGDTRRIDRWRIRQHVEAQPAASRFAHHHAQLEIGKPRRHLLEDGETIEMPEVCGAHEDPGTRLPQDVRDLVRAVEVDDGNHHRPQQAAPVEGGGGLHPVGELEGDDIAGADAAGAQSAGDTPRQQVDVAQRARPGMLPGAHPEGRRRTPPQAGLDQSAERLVVPQSPLPIAPRQLHGGGAKLRHHVDSPPGAPAPLYGRDRSGDAQARPWPRGHPLALTR